eukprot:RCo053922
MLSSFITPSIRGKKATGVAFQLSRCALTAEQFQHELHIRGGCQTFNQRWIIQSTGQIIDNLQMFIITGCNTNHQTRHFIFFRTELYTRRVLADYDTGLLHFIF